jgi:hypothetical protein
MNIKLLESWGGAEIGVSLSIDDVTGKNLIDREIAEKISARKGAAKSSGKDETK